MPPRGAGARTSEAGGACNTPASGIDFKGVNAMATLTQRPARVKPVRTVRIAVGPSEDNP